MTNLIKALVAGSALIAVAGTAAAERPVTADFTYSALAPVETTYARFQDTAKEACRVDRRAVRQMGARMRIEQACTRVLLAKAVAATKNQNLIAFHGEQIGVPATRRQLAALTR
ncbi:MAG: hypothetical protein AAF829_03520 [Pseudomonadota bacterium]